MERGVARSGVPRVEYHPTGREHFSADAAAARRGGYIWDSRTTARRGASRAVPDSDDADPGRAAFTAYRGAGSDVRGGDGVCPARAVGSGGGRMSATIDFRTEPSKYRHWRIVFDGAVAQLLMDVDPAGGLFDGYELKLNSYDLGVDIELHDAVQRLRFEHPEVRTVVLSSGKPGMFCAGANIRMLGKASHGHKVNFCKFTNETRMAIEDATEHSGQF